MSTYGAAFDRLAARWAALENEHDLVHPDRGQCGGVGGCAMMCTAHDRETEMMQALDAWRIRNAARLPR